MHWFCRAVIAVEIGCGWLIVWLAGFDLLQKRPAEWMEAQRAGELFLVLMLYGSLVLPTALISVTTYGVLTVGSCQSTARAAFRYCPRCGHFLGRALAVLSPHRHGLMAGPQPPATLQCEDILVLGSRAFKNGVEIPDPGLATLYD